MKKLSANRGYMMLVLELMKIGQYYGHRHQNCPYDIVKLKIIFPLLLRIDTLIVFIGVRKKNANNS
jgi:hypothetical protein